MKVSNCCGASNRSNGDTDFEDHGICPECKEHCEFEEESNSDLVLTAAEAKDLIPLPKSLTNAELFSEIEKSAKTGYDYHWLPLTKCQQSLLTSLGYRIRWSDSNKEWRVSW